MKIQRMLSRRYKEKEYYKYIIIIPEEDMKKAGFKGGDELIRNIKKGEIKLRIKK